MALTTGMLERFKKFVSNQDEHLLKITFSDKRKLYGYLREVGSDYFELEEVKKRENEAIKKIGKSVFDLSLLTEFAEIPEDQLPPIRRVIAV